MTLLRSKSGLLIAGGLMLLALFFALGSSSSVRAQSYGGCTVSPASGPAGTTATLTVTNFTAWADSALNMWWDFDEAAFGNFKNTGQGEEAIGTHLGYFQVEAIGYGSGIFVVPADATPGLHTISLGTPSLGGIDYGCTFTVTSGLPATGLKPWLLGLAALLLSAGIGLKVFSRKSAGFWQA